MITEEIANAIQAAGIERVKIRSVLTCETATRRLRQVLRPQPGDRHGWSTSARPSASSRPSRSASRAPS